MNFGLLKDTFASILVESHLSKDKSGKILYKKFLNLLKEDEILKSQFIVYKNIEDKNFKNEIDASNYLKENISALKRYKKEDIIKSNGKLLSLLESTGNKPDSNKKRPVHESINTLILSNGKAGNINKSHESFEVVKTWLLSDKSKNDNNMFVKEGVNPNKFLEIAVNKFNEKYSEITEEEKLIIKTLRENKMEDMETLFSTLVLENIDLVNSTLELYKDNITVKEKLLETKDVIYRMKENNESFSEKILKLYDLKSNLK